MSKKQHYVTRHLVGLMDHIYRCSQLMRRVPLFRSCFLSGVENYNLYYILFSGELPPSSGNWDSLRSLLGLLEEYKDRAPRYTKTVIIDEITIFCWIIEVLNIATLAAVDFMDLNSYLKWPD